MKIALITGSCGLVGSESSLFFSKKGFKIIGIDNNYRKFFFGNDGDVTWVKKKLKKSLKDYTHHNTDIRNYNSLKKIFNKYKDKIKVIIHAAAQPSHDWAKNKPFTDFDINAKGTLNLLELTKLYAPKAAFIFMSTNKVYGDNPNKLPLEEKKTRWELKKSHKFHNGIDVAKDFLVLDDITEGFQLPTVMDIKIGKQTWGPDASEDKKIRESSKYCGTKGPFGFRLVWQPVSFVF